MSGKRPGYLLTMSFGDSLVAFSFSGISQTEKQQKNNGNSTQIL
ncbi:hypothetical protein [Gudongella oleilytica]|jgi:hypothetical protein|nr:hypothetical protein [Gudongella oleilytica]MDY0257735.1 hypothetical protein [Gudongella oleilytica]